MAADAPAATGAANADEEPRRRRSSVAEMAAALEVAMQNDSSDDDYGGGAKPLPAQAVRAEVEAAKAKAKAIAEAGGLPQAAEGTPDYKAKDRGEGRGRRLSNVQQMALAVSCGRACVAASVAPNATRVAQLSPPETDSEAEKTPRAKKEPKPEKIPTSERRRKSVTISIVSGRSQHA